MRNVNIQVRTVPKWKAHAEVSQAISRLHHKEVISKVQTGRAGTVWGEAPWFWSKASRKERKELVVAEVTRIENECYRIQVLVQG